MNYLKYLLLAALLLGCSKDPTELEKAPVLESVSFSDSICAENRYPYGITYRECKISIELVYVIQNYSLVLTDSDSEDVRVYLNNGKIITTPFNGPGTLIDEVLLSKKTRSIYASWFSDTTAHVLRASDTLSTIDSSVVDIWWWYNGSRQTFHYKF